MTPPPQGGVSSGVAVDPYLVGAIFQEVTPAGVVVQESSASGADGAFSFAKALTIGNVVRLAVGGQHNGVPYSVTLKRSVDVSSGTIVVSPLTTLVADGTLTASQVVSMLNSATGASLTVDDLFADPMARLLDGDVSASDRQLLAAAIASSSALQILGGNVGSAELDDVITAVAPKLLTVLQSVGAPEAVASAAAAVADFIARNADSPSEAQSLADQVHPALITLLVQAAAGGQNAAIIEAGGTIVAGTSAGTIAEHLARGTEALQSALTSRATDRFLEAANRFTAAAALADVDETATANDRDRARFFGAVARLALLAQPYSDGQRDGLQDLGDILDGFGLGGTAAQRANLGTFDMEKCVTQTYQPYPGYTYSWEECELKPLASESPRSAEMQAFFTNQVGSALTAAITLLDDVSAGFSTKIEHSERSVEIDNTDVLFVKSVAHALLADINLQQAYDLDLDLDALQADRQQDGYDVPDFLAQYPTFLKLKDSATVAAAVPAARQNGLAAVSALKAAIASLEQEEDSQADDLVRLSSETCSYTPATGYTCTQSFNPAEQLAEIKRALAQIEGPLAAQGTYVVTMGTTDPSDDVTVDVDKFFTGVDVRAMFPAAYTAGAFGDRPGLFPDPSFGGVIVSAPRDVNEDLDQDGSPDIFGGYTYFFDGYLVGGPFQTYWPFTPEPNTWISSSAFTFAPGGAFQHVVTTTAQVLDPVLGYPVWTSSTTNYTGSYTMQQNVLTMTFDGVGPFNVKTLSAAADGFDDYGFNAQVAFQDAAGASLTPQYPFMSWYRYY